MGDLKFRFFFQRVCLLGLIRYARSSDRFILRFVVWDDGVVGFLLEWIEDGLIWWRMTGIVLELDGFRVGLK